MKGHWTTNKKPDKKPFPTQSQNVLQGVFLYPLISFYSKIKVKQYVEWQGKMFEGKTFG